MYIGGKWHLLTPIFDISKLGVIDCLDVSILQNYVLAPILGIDDPRTSKRIDFVGGIRGTGELEKLVNDGKMAVAFSMFPTTVGQMMAIADPVRSCRRSQLGLNRSCAMALSVIIFKRVPVP